MKNTNIDGSHPNRKVLFLNKSTVIPQLSAASFSYHFGFRLDTKDIESIDEFRPTLVHVTVPDFSSLSIIDYARENSIPIMGTFHSNYVEYMDHYKGFGFLKPYAKFAIRHHCSFLQALYVPTPFIKRHLCADEYRLDLCTNLKIWGRGYDVDKFSPDNRCNLFRQKIGAYPKDVIICMVGRLVREKRVDIFANVIKRLHERGVNYRGLVVGDGPCKSLVMDLPNTCFAGWMGPNELKVAYASSDIFLFPSAVETFGNVTLEALGSGLPIVVEEGCSGHLVKNGMNGYACSAGDEDDFFKATLDLVTNPERRKKFSECAREHSMLYEQHAVMKSMLDNYDEITEEFHTKYQGRHSKRDATRHNFIFRGGTYASPYGICCMELFVSTVFRVLEMMLFFTACIKNRLLPGTIGINEQIHYFELNEGEAKAELNVKTSSNVLIEDDMDNSFESPTKSTRTALGDRECSIRIGEMIVLVVMNWMRCTSNLSTNISKCIRLPRFSRDHSKKKQEENDVDIVVFGREPINERKLKSRRAVFAV